MQPVENFFKAINTLFGFVPNFTSDKTLDLISFLAPFSYLFGSLFIAQLVVEDADHGSNGRVTFTVNSNKFAVNSSTGILYTTQTLDREQQAQYQLTVQATDGGGGAAKVGS